MSQEEYLWCLYCKGVSFRKESTWVKHLKVHLGEWYMICSVCGTLKDWRHRGSLDRPSQTAKCAGFVKEEWQIDQGEAEEHLVLGVWHVISCL